MFRFRRFTPDILVEKLIDIPLDELHQRGIEGIIFDVDNTITEWRSPNVSDEIIEWFYDLPNQGFKTCILSNNSSTRVGIISEKLHTPYLCNARKPLSNGFKRAQKLLKLPMSQMAMVGDQIFTDIWGGNQAGLLTIFVERISVNEFWGTKNISRRAERMIWKKIDRNMSQR